MADERHLYYLRLEGINLCKFVLDTKDLSTIRGSGLLLLDAVSALDPESEEKPETFKTLCKSLEERDWQAISLGASIGLFSFLAENDQDAEEVRKTVEKRFNEEGDYQYATFAIDVIAATSDFNFKRDRELLLAKNRWRQLQSPNLVLSPEFAKYHGPDAFCALTRVRQGQVETKMPDGTQKKVSLSAKRRQRFGRSEKHVFYNRFPPPRFEEDQEKVAAHFEELTRVPPELAVDGDDRLAWDADRLKDKMAVLYVDGNRFSEKQTDFDADDLERWDRHLRSERAAFMNAFLDEVQNDRTWFTRHETRGKLRTVIRMEVLMWGGDEFLFVLPAWHGWWAASVFFGTAWEFDGEPLTHSAGLVFCHHNAPIARVKDVASELCALAKATGEPEANKLAYLTLESFDHVGLDLHGFFQGFLPAGCHPEDWVLSGDELDEWQRSFSKLKAELPKTRVQRAAFAASRGIEKSLEDLLRRSEGSEGYDDAEIKAAWRKLRSYNERRTELSKTAFCVSEKKAMALRAVHLSLLWDYVAPDLPNDRSLSNPLPHPPPGLPGQGEGEGGGTRALSHA